MSLLTELDAFYTEHRRCGQLEAGVNGPIIWMACECGAVLSRSDPTHIDPYGPKAQ